MENAVSVQTLEFLHSSLFGIVAALFYDLLRVIRTYTSKKRWVIAVFDALFWTVTIISLFAFVLTRSGGNMRWYILVGAFCGGVVYRATASEIVFKLLKSTADLIIRLLSLSTRPIYLLLERIAACGRAAEKKVARNIRQKKQMRKDDGNGNKKETEKKHFS